MEVTEVWLFSDKATLTSIRQASNIQTCKKQVLWDVGSNGSAFSDCYFCAIAIYSIIDSKRWHFLFHVHAAFRLVHNATQLLLTKRDSWFIVLLFFYFLVMCVQPCHRPLIFSLKLPSHISSIYTFCLHSCLSLIGWQVCGRRCWLIYWVLWVLVVHVWLASS